MQFFLRNRAIIVFGAMLVLFLKTPLHVAAGVITFSDQTQSGEPRMSVIPYTNTTLAGLPAGVTMTLSSSTVRKQALASFSTSDGVAISLSDHTQDGVNRFMEIMNNSASMSFSTPVEIPSLWVNTGLSNGGQSGNTVQGFLAGVSQFSYTNALNSNAWVEVTDGAGLLIDKLTFSPFVSSLVDDITINLNPQTLAVPEPASLSLVGTGLLVFTTQKRRGSVRY